MSYVYLFLYVYGAIKVIKKLSSDYELSLPEEMPVDLDTCCLNV